MIELMTTTTTIALYLPDCLRGLLDCDFFHCSACAFDMYLLNYLLTYLLDHDDDGELMVVVCF